MRKARSWHTSRLWRRTWLAWVALGRHVRSFLLALEEAVETFQRGTLGQSKSWAREGHIARQSVGCIDRIKLSTTQLKVFGSADTPRCRDSQSRRRRRNRFRHSRFPLHADRAQLQVPSWLDRHFGTCVAARTFQRCIKALRTPRLECLVQQVFTFGATQSTRQHRRICFVHMHNCIFAREHWCGR